MDNTATVELAGESLATTSSQPDWLEAVSGFRSRSRGRSLGADGGSESGTCTNFEEAAEPSSECQGVVRDSGDDRLLMLNTIKWLEAMDRRVWATDLKNSWYRQFISCMNRLAAIAILAEPHVGGKTNTSPILYLTMKEAGAKLTEPYPPAGLILIRCSGGAATDGTGIRDFLEGLRGYRKVDVQDPRRKVGGSLATSWNTSKVVNRFGMNTPPEQEPPINLLDLDCTQPKVVPDCFIPDNMRFLSKLKPDAGRPAIGSSIKVEWCLLGQAGSGSLPHFDHCGFWTWVMVQEGLKLWLVCKLSDDERKTFASEGINFSGGEWYIVPMRKGDVIVMAPGTVHAVFSPVDTLCFGGNAWSNFTMGDTMKSIYEERVNPAVTNDNQPSELSSLLDEAARRIRVSGSMDKYGGRDQVDMFFKYYKVGNPICPVVITNKPRGLEMEGDK
ncbi:hypothetical protein GP486_003217 [Trichoglossum hirsutum]|uniref:JmjC domain-containing protein n=1 Tax=Trichoglossum hirsutum TaxID=265104 RepID=A0A9P8LDN0_9PEZI|nr:hypothetical protein GP486_003217 [Trichoglossum hirsutum]